VPEFVHARERELMHAECARAFELYRERIGRGVAKEIARMLLPQSIYTQAYWTVSLQGIMHFLDQRLKADAQYEIRRYAKAVYELVREDLERVGMQLDDPT
jgi:thymidylate synthase (FAD)